MIEKLCTPAIVYLGFSIIQIVIDTFKGMYNAAFMKTLVMVLMTLVLNILCNRNLSIIAWLIVFIPFILMTYITSLLLFVFGLNPSKDDQDYNVVYPENRVVSKTNTNIAKTSSNVYVNNNNNSNDNNNNNNNNNNYDNNDYDNDNISENIKKAIYDMKFFISLNKQEKNTILFAWCPEYYSRSRSVVYIVAGKNINNTIYLHRIAQNPYYENIINIRSIDFVKDLNELIEKNNFLKDVNYDELHKYDNRYLLSWNTLLI